MLAEGAGMIPRSQSVFRILPGKLKEKDVSPCFSYTPPYRRAKLWAKQAKSTENCRIWVSLLYLLQKIGVFPLKRTLSFRILSHIACVIIDRKSVV